MSKLPTARRTVEVYAKTKRGDSCLVRIAGKGEWLLAVIHNTYNGAAWRVMMPDGKIVTLPVGTDCALLTDEEFPDLPPLRDLQPSFETIEKAREYFATWHARKGAVRKDDCIARVQVPFED